MLIDKLVKLARQNKRCKIVTFDWLEDSLLEKRRKPEKAYYVANIVGGKRCIKRTLAENTQKRIKDGSKGSHIPWTISSS